VAAGAGPVPPRLASYRIVRRRGWLHEIIIPTAWRQEYERLGQMQARRDTSFNAARELAARWLEGNQAPPADELALTAAEVRRWRAPYRLIAFGQDCATGSYGAAARPLGSELAAWARQDLMILAARPRLVRRATNPAVSHCRARTCRTGAAAEASHGPGPARMPWTSAIPRRTRIIVREKAAH
jgi:hypothetical protein